MSFNDFTKFDKMITPTIIKFLFWVGVALSVIAGLAMLFQGGVSSLFGILTIVIGPLFTRLYCELLIVIFKIHENLVAIRQQSEQN